MRQREVWMQKKKMWLTNVIEMIEFVDQTSGMGRARSLAALGMTSTKMEDANSDV